MKNKILLLLIITLFLTGCSKENNLQTGSQYQTATSDSKESILNELKSVTAQKSQEYSVTYSQEMEGQGLVDVTLYVKGKKMMMDSSSNQGKASFYFLETVAYICTYQDKWQCLTVGTDKKQESPTEIKYEWEQYNNSTEFNVVRDGSITVAGTVAKCYKSEYEKTSQRFCLSKEGVFHKND